jgi:hypothetical protein
MGIAIAERQVETLSKGQLVVSRWRWWLVNSHFRDSPFRLRSQQTAILRRDATAARSSRGNEAPLTKFQIKGHALRDRIKGQAPNS